MRGREQGGWGIGGSHVWIPGGEGEQCKELGVGMGYLLAKEATNAGRSLVCPYDRSVASGAGLRGRVVRDEMRVLGRASFCSKDLEFILRVRGSHRN